MKHNPRNKSEIIPAIREIAEAKGIDEDSLLKTLEDALAQAYSKEIKVDLKTMDVKVVINKDNGEIKIYQRKTIVEEVNDDEIEIELEDAKEIDKKYQMGDIVEIDVTPKDFMRVAAQSAKQIVTQRIREAERAIIYNEFHEKEFDIISGIVQRTDRGNVYVDLGKIEAILGPNEQIPGERYSFNERIQLYIVEVKENTKGPTISVSRTHPGLVRRLFEREVPEIFDGVVEIKSISREPGSRTKIAVHSKDENVDATGACVGNKGQRVQNIVNELKNEKIDIIEWDKDPAKFIENSLSPAKVIAVYVDETKNEAKVITDATQLSLAIGKEGQNVRLAAKLTNWKIDIKSEKDAEGLELQNVYLKDVKSEDKNEEKAEANDEKLEDAKDLNEEVKEDVKEEENSDETVKATSDENSNEEINLEKEDEDFEITGSIEDMFIDPDFEVEEKEGIEEEHTEKTKKKDKKKKKHQEEVEDEFEDDIEEELEQKKRAKQKAKSKKVKIEEEF